MKNKKLLVLIPALLLTVGTLGACGGSKKSSEPASTSESSVAVTGVTLDKATAELGVGDSLTLKATVTPNNATNTKVTWESSDTAVATVSNLGKV